MNPNFMKTLWKGWKPIDRLDVSVSGNIFKYPDAIQQKVEQKRQEIYTSDKAKGKNIRDSDLYRAEHIDISDEYCKVTLGMMKRSELHTIKRLPELGAQLQISQFSHGIAVSCLVETNDGYFLFGERGNTNAGREGGELAMIGGTLQPDEGIVSSYIGMYAHVLRELYEEVGIAQQYIYDQKVVGIQRMQNGGMGFVYYLTLSISKDEVQNMFEQKNDGEFQSLIYIPSSEAPGYLEERCCKNEKVIRTMGLNIEYIHTILAKK